jgi:hypothetical protein
LASSGVGLTTQPWREVDRDCLTESGPDAFGIDMSEAGLRDILYEVIESGISPYANQPTHSGSERQKSESLDARHPPPRLNS